MFGIGSTELLVILVVALIVLGPKTLASVSRSLGKILGEFRRVSTDFQRSLNVEAAREEMKANKADKATAASAPTDTGSVAASGNSSPIKQAQQKEFSGPPADSPLGQAIAKAKAEADRGVSKSPPATAPEPAANMQSPKGDQAHD